MKITASLLLPHERKFLSESQPMIGLGHLLLYPRLKWPTLCGSLCPRSLPPSNSAYAPSTLSGSWIGPWRLQERGKSRSQSREGGNAQLPIKKTLRRPRPTSYALSEVGAKNASVRVIVGRNAETLLNQKVEKNSTSSMEPGVTQPLREVLEQGA